MGTNYYSVKRGVDYENVESFWDLRGTEDFIHIGKRSGGWCFCLLVVPEVGINAYEDWVRMFIDPDRIIINEYNDVIPFAEMIRIITARGRSDTCKWDMERLNSNYAELGPSNLVRFRIEHERTRGCVGHGEGTWDLIAGDFS